MSAKLVLVPNKLGSQSCKKLAELLSSKLGYKVFRVTASRVGKRIPFLFTSGTDKLTQLRKFKDNGIPTPEFTTEKSIAEEWIDDGFTVFCRTLLKSSEGKGIIVAGTKEQLVNAPLYTKYFKKKREFRVHVFNGEVIDVQEKRKKRDFSNERDTKIRNTANGYVFCRNDLVEPTELRDIAKAATNSLEYFIGAVDIAYNESANKLVVLEVNATPGLTGTTLENYSNSILNWYKGKI